MVRAEAPFRSRNPQVELICLLAPSGVAPREVRFAHPRQAAPATPFTRSRATMPPEEPPRTEPGTLALVRGKRFNTHEKVIFQGDVRGKRFSMHGR